MASDTDTKTPSSARLRAKLEVLRREARERDAAAEAQARAVAARRAAEAQAAGIQKAGAQKAGAEAAGAQAMAAKSGRSAKPSSRPQAAAGGASHTGAPSSSAPQADAPQSSAPRRAATARSAKASEAAPPASSGGALVPLSGRGESLPARRRTTAPARRRRARRPEDEEIRPPEPEADPAVDEPEPEDELEEAPPAPVSPWGLVRSPLMRFILLANFAGLAVLMYAVFGMGETREELMRERLYLLQTQSEVIAQFIAEGAVDETPTLYPDQAVALLARLPFAEKVSVRLFDETGAIIRGSDSRFIGGRVLSEPVPELPATGVLETLDHVIGDRLRDSADATQAEELTMDQQVVQVLNDVEPVLAQRVEDGGRVLSVAVPIQRVQAVLGVVLIEAADVDQVIAAERRAMRPIAIIAASVAFASSALLALWIAGPVRRLVIAAHHLRKSGLQQATIPDLSKRGDEIGELSVALSGMTQGLSERVKAIERFGADVAHELKNPLTSIRSAAETLLVARDPDQQKHLMTIIRKDADRIDRLITDIARASAVDAELAGARATAIELSRFLQNLVELYQAIRREDEPDVLFELPEDLGRYQVLAAETQLGHVFRNLIDNARTFSPPDEAVRVGIRRARMGGRPVVVGHVEDRGPGVPPENLKRIFNRFYTNRPQGAAFGSNSGLGLAIAKQIVEAQHGRIWAENVMSRSGRVLGARFSVALPLER